MRKVRLRTESIRLAQFLKWAGLAETGGKARELIMEGMIRVNGKRELSAGRRLFPGDLVGLVDDDPVMVVSASEEG